jgi:DNA polymerase III subunit alpha
VLEFVHLQVKSGYSLLNSTCSIQDLVKTASDKGFKALALTDENVMYGAVTFYKECIANGIKPIIGLTVQLDSDSTEERAYPLLLLAKNNNGYKMLIKISSLVQTNGKQSITKRQFQQYCKDLIALSPGKRGEIEQFLNSGDYKSAFNLASKYKKLLKEDFYFTIQNHFDADEKHIMPLLLKLAKELNIQIVATNDVHYLVQEDALVHECVAAIRSGKKMSDDDRPKLSSSHYYLKSELEMKELFSNLPVALTNTVTIANKCMFDISFGNYVIPTYPVPEGKNASEYLENICYEGLHNRYETVTTEIEERLQYELSIIKRMKFDDYFLIVWDFMKFAHDHNILTGPGRGSAAGSLVAYTLQITNVDPIEHDLLFERFLNPERVSMPDIDIDFPDAKRDEMIRYVQQKYGNERTAQIVTFGTLAARASIRDVGRVTGLSQKEVDIIVRHIPSRPNVTLMDAYHESKGLRDILKESTASRRVFDIARKIEGLPRHTSTHAAGVVISDEPLTEYAPVQSGQSEVLLTQYSMDVLEEIGLLKMDFLGLRNLTIIERILQLIYKNTNEKINIDNIPFQNDKTFQLLCDGDTTGVFQLESTGMRKVLRKLKPSEFEDIVAVNALYRPGPMDNIPLYIERKHKESHVEYLHPDLEPILKKTYGVIVYQEQIIQIASKMAGFSLGEADLLRRAVSKKKREVLDEQRNHFVRGCKAQGYEESIANDLYDLIVRFANYGFNRSHAVAYSVIAYQLAYLKANFPLYFTAAILTSVVGNDEKTAQYVGEAKQKNIPILPPSINRSSYNFYVNSDKILFSMASVKNVGIAALKEIFSKREQKDFEDLFDFCVRVSMKKINRKTIESLIFSGAFDEFGKERSTLLASLDAAIEYSELVSEDDGPELFFPEELIPKPEYVEVAPFNETEKLNFEKEALGFYLSSHPIEQYKDLLMQYKSIPISTVKTTAARTRIHLGAYVTGVRIIKTKKGDQMAFVTLSDQTGDIDGVAFPEFYHSHYALIDKGALLFIDGLVEQRNEQIQVILNKVKPLDTLLEVDNESVNQLYIKINSNQQANEVVLEVKRTLKRFPGDVTVFVFYETTKKYVKLSSEFKVDGSQGCMNALKTILGPEHVVLKNV